MHYKSYMWFNHCKLSDENNRPSKTYPVLFTFLALRRCWGFKLQRHRAYFKEFGTKQMRALRQAQWPEQAQRITCKSMCLLKCFAHNQLCTRAFLWQPTSSDEPKNKCERRLKIVHCLSFGVFAEVSLDDFSLSHASFSSEMGAVLTFFAYFFASRQKE